MTHLNTRTQPCGDAVQHVVGVPAFSADLFEHVLSAENMRSAWEHVRANKGAAGIDKMTISDFPEWAKANWTRVKAELWAGTYQPQPVRRVEIEKPGGGIRPLGIPTIPDRVIQQAIAQVLTPIFDPGFSAYSYGYRPKRSAADAVKQIHGDMKQGRRIVVDIDLSKFFDRVNHDRLMSLLGQKVGDKRLLALIGRYLRAGVMVDKVIQPSRLGVPQGGPLSPLLANIMLDPWDKELEKRGHKFARYADDIIIVVKSQRAGERVLGSATRYLEDRLKLQVNTDKSRVVKPAKSKFLGFCFPQGRIQWHAKSLEKFRARVRELTNRNWGVSMKYRLDQLGMFLRGWINYFGIASGYQHCLEVDSWIRRRIRMCYWQQWRKPVTRIRNLIKRGVPEDLAVKCGASQKGQWRSSKTAGIQLALSNDYLKAQGLYELRLGWIALHH